MNTHARLPSPGLTSGRLRAPWKVWATTFLTLLLLALPLAVSWQVTGSNPVQAAFQQDTNPRADYWRAVRDGVRGYTAVVGQETDVLIQGSGQNWREIRNGVVTTIGAWLLGIVVVLLLLFHFVVGKARLEERTGRKVMRWTLFERILHWYVAILFIVLAVTGLSLLYGRAVLIPLLGPETFAAYADLAKDAHNYLALFFVAGLVVMLLLWLRESLFTRVDWEWFRTGGGYLGNRQHAHAYKVNAGEKAWYWVLVLAGGALMFSGTVLLFPNLGFERATMQGGLVIHGLSALLLVAFSLGHIYLGTLGNEGSFEGMISGEVDEGWARQHHDLWYRELQQGPESTGKEAAAATARAPPQAT